jgi:methylated-DNA-[protein]-cysteine S-methyltransferase
MNVPAPVETTRYAAKLATPFAMLGLQTNGAALTGLTFLPLSERAADPGDRVAERAARELELYLRDPGYRFTVALEPSGTPFQQRVWTVLSTIPRGESRTYGDVARQVGSAPRAVGQACGANPIALIIPCHRVMGAQGALGGFMHASAGDSVAIKRWLLAHEGLFFGA